LRGIAGGRNIEQIKTAELLKVAREVVESVGPVGPYSDLYMCWGMCKERFKDRCGNSATTLEGRVVFKKAVKEAHKEFQKEMFE